jgi:branched-chain amino acid transport system substrate-binding protein
VADGVIEWSDDFGVRVLGRHTYDPAVSGEDGLEATVAHMLAADPDAIVVSTYPPDGYRVLEALRVAEDRLPKAIAMTITPVHPTFGRRAGAIAEGIFAPSQWEPITRIPFPETLRFITSFRQYAGTDPSYHAAAAYAGGRILEKAVSDTGTLEHARLAEYIGRLDSATIIGRFRVDSTGRQVGHTPMLIQWQDGHKQIVYPRSLRTATPRFGER